MKSYFILGFAIFSFLYSIYQTISRRRQIGFSSNGFLDNKIVWKGFNQKWLFIVSIATFLLVLSIMAQVLFVMSQKIYEPDAYTPFFQILILYIFIFFISKKNNRDMNGDYWFSYKCNLPVLVVVSSVISIIIMIFVVFGEKIDFFSILSSFLLAIILTLTISFSVYLNCSSLEQCYFMNSDSIIKRSLLDYNKIKFKIYLKSIQTINVEELYGKYSVYPRKGILVSLEDGKTENLFVSKPYKVAEIINKRIDEVKNLIT